MYKVLLVDDEMPALRFMQAIIDKHAPDFCVQESCASGEAALAYLKDNEVDLLLTDISMPGMDGIALALQARSLFPGIHIVIVSGYAEFEYAKGAIQASVDDYILKPVGIAQITEILCRIKERLDEENAAREPALLSAMLTHQPYDRQLAAKLYGEGPYFFAYARWGNLQLPTGEFHMTSAVPANDLPFGALYGRDEDEQILYRKADGPAADFHAAVKAYVAQRQSATWTIVFARAGGAFTALPAFFASASQLMERTVVVGRHQYVFLSGAAPSTDPPRIAGATLKKLQLFIEDANAKMVKDIFISLAVDWEKRQIPQVYVSTMVQHLVHLVMTCNPTLGAQQDLIMRSAGELLRYATSYGELMAGLYSVLFDDSKPRDRKLSAEDLYAYAIRYIQEKYAQPISVQHVCAEIGISQTYLSRLFRKYGDMSFNVYLTKCRMDNAMALIHEHPDMPLRNVAACVGYDDYAYFSKVFHQTAGCSPSQWALSPVEKQGPPRDEAEAT